MAVSEATLAPWLQRQLQPLLSQRGHAWLLQGPAGLGQFELGLALVQAWLCDAPTAQGACGGCASCHGVAVHTHTDLTVLMPETEMLERGWPLSEKAQIQIDEKQRKPSREIRVEALRETIEFAQITSGRGRGKAVLVYPAERMNAVAANALLKTLEEPPGDVRFVLASTAAHQLLPTIRSRCQTHTMAWPHESEALPWLLGLGLAGNEGEARTLLHAVGGRPAAALGWADGEEGMRAWTALPAALARGEVAPLAGLSLPEAVDRLQKLCHDLMVLQVGASPRFFDAANLPARPLSMRALTVWWGKLSLSARNAEHPLNAGLAAEFLASAARQALNSRA